MCKFINKEWVSRCDDYFYKEKIKRKNNSIKLTAQEIEDIVNNVKTLADKKLRFFNRNSEKIVQTSLFTRNNEEKQYDSIKEKCKQCYLNIENIESWEDEIELRKENIFKYLIKVVPNENYISSIFGPCKEYIKQILEEEVDKVNEFLKQSESELKDEYRKILKLKYKAEDINKYGELVVTNVPEIEQKYTRLREEVSKNDNPKHLKISGDKMLYVYEGDDCCSIDDNFEAFKMKYNRMIEEIIDTGLYDIDLVTIQCFMNCLSRIINIIIDKYNNIMKSKDIYAGEVYLSNSEHVTIAEICELVDEYDNIKNCIRTEIRGLDESGLKEETKTYYLHKFEEGFRNTTIIGSYEEKFVNDKYKKFDILLGEEKILKEYLYWIFSRDNRKEPVFGIEIYDNCWVDRDEDWGMI